MRSGYNAITVPVEMVKAATCEPLLTKKNLLSSISINDIINTYVSGDNINGDKKRSISPASHKLMDDYRIKQIKEQQRVRNKSLPLDKHLMQPALTVDHIFNLDDIPFVTNRYVHTFTFFSIIL